MSIGWVLFLFDTKTVAGFLQQLLGIGNAVRVADPSIEMWGGVIIAAFVCFGVNLEKLANNKAKGRFWQLLQNAGFAVAILAVLFFLDRSQTFIYFRF